MIDSLPGKIMKRIILLFLYCSALIAEEKLNLIADPHFSPYAGGEDLIGGFRLLESSIDGYYRYSDDPENKSSGNAIQRLAELALFWDPVGRYLSTAQHEVFGHGYRVRSLKGHVSKYNIGVPFPYARGGGYTMFRYTNRWTPFQMLAVDTGGVEANAILANQIKMHWLQADRVDPCMAVFYLSSQHNLTQYIFYTKNSQFDLGDIKKYVDLLNNIYRDQGHLSLSSLKKQAWINFLDPFTYLSLYSWGNFVLTGAKKAPPMFRLGEYGYLPGAKLGLTPFGPEYYLENYLVKEGAPIYFYLRYGQHAGHAYSGVGVEHPSFLWKSGTTTIGLRVDGWYQPHTAFQDRRFSYQEYNQKWRAGEALPEVPYDPKAGASASLILRTQFSPGFLFCQIGGKSKGFVAGESLDAALTARGGISFSW